MTEQHEMLAARLRTKIGVKGQECKDPSGGGAKPFGDDLRGFHRDISETLGDRLQCGQDELLALFPILRLVMAINVRT